MGMAIAFFCLEVDATNAMSRTLWRKPHWQRQKSGCNHNVTDMALTGQSDFEAVQGCVDGTKARRMVSRINALGWSTWVLIVVLVALVVLAFVLVTPAA